MQERTNKLTWYIFKSVVQSTVSYSEYLSSVCVGCKKSSVLQASLAEARGQKSEEAD